MCMIVERNAHMTQLSLFDNHIIGFGNDALGQCSDGREVAKMQEIA